MKNLILIRHAKSSWNAPLNDKDRPLSKRGIDNAHQISQAIKDFLPKTNLIWSSSARRTKETAIIFAQNLQWPIENIVFKEELYTFDENQLQKVVTSCNDDYENLILFGHNDAITNFVNKFGDAYIDNVPTSGFVSISLPINSWANLKKGTTNKMFFPRDL